MITRESFPTVHANGANQLKTQISGKYSLDNPGVFDFKRQLTEAGVGVMFPVGDEIIEHSCGFAITVPEEAETPFHTTEVSFLREIKANPIQITYNLHGENDGYIGESTGLETMYALVRNKPTVLLREPTGYSTTIAEPIRDLIERHRDKMTVEPLDRLGTSDLQERIASLALVDVDYGLTDTERQTVMFAALALTRKYRRDWEEYQLIKQDAAFQGAAILEA